MTRRALLFFSLLLLLVAQSQAEGVTIRAADGVQVNAEYWPSAIKDAPLILAFHQAGSSHAEYDPIAPRLNRAGFNVLAIDQRSGGGEFGGKNLTVAALGHSASYEAAFADLEAALAWGRQQPGGGRLLVWGSSYSAALVFLLAAKHPAVIKGVLAFSPGEYLEAPDAVATAAHKVRVPVFIDQSDEAEEIEQSRAIMGALEGNEKTQFIAKGHSVHGSATLREDRNPGGSEEHWSAVLGFLSRFRAGQ